MASLFPRLGVIRSRDAIFHLRHRPLPFLIYVPSSHHFLCPYIRPVVPRLGVIRLRRANDL